MKRGKRLRQVTISLQGLFLAGEQEGADSQEYAQPDKAFDQEEQEARQPEPFYPLYYFFLP
jgi:hypothetical protein